MARVKVERTVGVELTGKITRYLKKHGCLVIESKAGTLIFFKDGFWGALEVKKSKTAKFQPLQKEMVAKMDEMSWARVVYPENWEEIQKELEEIL